MNNKIILNGRKIRLEPINDEHYQALENIVLSNPDIYRYTTMGTTKADFARWFSLACQHSAWVVILQQGGEVVGSTRIYNANTAAQAVTLGYTWYSPESRGTGINTEAKYLLLSHLFENCDINRIQFEINADNIASRKAVEKLGTQLEGVLKQSRVTHAGERADTCIYGLLAEQWPHTKNTLQLTLGIS